ncbi:MAG: hypothetical protein AABY68_09620 [Pseudomonadota bacterium]
MLVLLVASGTLEQVSERLGYSLDQVRRLPAAIHQLRKSKSFRDSYGEAVLQRIAPIIASIPEAPTPDNIDLLDALSEVVDTGEAQLMAIAAATSCTLLISGDKRAIADLAASQATDCIRELQGRLVTLEAVLWMLVTDAGAGTVRSAFAPVMNHKTLRIVLSPHAAAEQQRCLAGIQSYYNELAQSAGGLLFNPAPESLG